jgi:hypothetical protein
MPAKSDIIGVKIFVPLGPIIVLQLRGIIVSWRIVGIDSSLGLGGMLDHRNRSLEIN